MLTTDGLGQWSSASSSVSQYPLTCRRDRQKEYPLAATMHESAVSYPGHLWVNPEMHRYKPRLLVEKPEEKRPLENPRRRWEDNTKMDFWEVGYDCRDRINLAQDRDRWRAYELRLTFHFVDIYSDKESKSIDSRIDTKKLETICVNSEHRERLNQDDRSIFNHMVYNANMAFRSQPGRLHHHVHNDPIKHSSRLLLIGSIRPQISLFLNAETHRVVHTPLRSYHKKYQL
ncbi:hypothetical protein ANN_13100 [Periplaneta americana]|uniref:Uncharacterized protein n=1 Tax=Periplaneta americana TaxID=6978 RepID=A0ABQ8TKK8_PERAM|nr:hypothetical protein ANN_13100 [Periplaneta americana]